MARLASHCLCIHVFLATVLYTCRSAEVIITMRNRGIESYKPDEYGDTIIVHRTIRDDGTTAYKIKGADGTSTCKCACTTCVSACTNGLMM